MSEGRREKLLDIQKREQLKGLLINKFKLKYGDGQGASTVINSEVAKFLKNDRLTEENLRKLDDKIGKETELRAKKEQILADKKAGVDTQSRPRTTASQRGKDDDVRSVVSVASSRMSGATNLSKKSKAQDQMSVAGKSLRGGDDAVSQYSRKAPTEVYSELDEEDEWTAIQKFNTMLHYEEQKQSIMREKERKRLIKEELDRQLREKRDRKDREKNQDRMYEELQEKHLLLLDEKEREKQIEIKNKINAEKNSRDK